MPRYYFDVDGAPDDDDGVELPDFPAARAQAIIAAGEMLRDLDGALIEDWIMRVTDEARQRVLTLHFRAIEHDP